ncbi:acetyltransferase [Kordiimonas sp.]|uniref:acetyltransferase n=1 Tax=Kordiimonas sp. TaxID=1970157 RepID=UPI003A8FC4FC
MQGFLDETQTDTGAVLGLYGAGGCARDIMPFVRRQFPGKVYFIETNPEKTEVNGLPLISEDAFFKLSARPLYFNVAINDSLVRESIAERCIARGATPVSLRERNATVYDNNTIATGAILNANTTVTSNVVIGKFFHANIYSYVTHDCVIGDYVTFGPRVGINGNVHIGDHAYIGAGATVKPGDAARPLRIGKGAVVGMGAVVTKDIDDGQTVVGNPARVLRP